MENQSSNYLTACTLARELSKQHGQTYSIVTIETCYEPRVQTERTRHVCLVAGELADGCQLNVVAIDRSVARMALLLTGMLRAQPLSDEGSVQ